MYDKSRVFISDDIRFTGADDPELEKFESQYPTEGISYNSYVILDEKTAIMDTVDERGSEQFFDNLKAELKDRVRENIDMKKTISKMQQQHEAEVADLKDRIMEAEAEANAAKKRKDEILKERTQYADALDNDSVAFEEILSLAETNQLVSTASAKLAKQIITKTEGRI